MLVFPELAEYAQTGHVTMHWSRAVLASLFLVLALILVTTAFLLRLTDLLRNERRSLLGRRLPPDRLRPGEEPRSLGGA